MKMTKDNYQDLFKIAEISNNHVRLKSRMTQEEWDNFENQSLTKFESRYNVHPLKQNYHEELQKAIKSGNILISDFLTLFKLHIEFIINLKEEYPHINIYHNENNFEEWFEQFSLKDAHQIFSSLEDIIKEEIFPGYNIYLLEIKRFTYYCRGIVTNQNLYQTYCVTAPILFPQNRKELSDIGRKMAAIFYLELLSKIFDKNQNLKKNLDSYDLNNLDHCITARRISGIFSIL